ncbi:MAG: hypothetical protein KF830_18545 [Planctomycetes bacterium]|nr:hypothetical protein [Planctomycetota bacterium]
MDAMPGAQPKLPPNPAWIVGTNPAPPREPAVAVADPADAPLRSSTSERGRVSVDPMRTTDRYRLVMPYAEAL